MNGVTEGTDRMDGQNGWTEWTDGMDGLNRQKGWTDGREGRTEQAEGSDRRMHEMKGRNGWAYTLAHGRINGWTEEYMDRPVDKRTAGRRNDWRTNGRKYKNVFFFSRKQKQKTEEINQTKP